MSGYVPVGQIPVMPQARITPELRRCFIEAKQKIATAPQSELERFKNAYGIAKGDGSPLPKLSHGCEYLEFDVGHGRIDRGARRLVFEVNMSSRRILYAYYSDAHYLKGSFEQMPIP